MLRHAYAIDLESTGFSVSKDRIIQIAASKLTDGSCTWVCDVYTTRAMNPYAARVTGIPRADTPGRVKIRDAIHSLLTWVHETSGGASVVLLAHNGIRFDFPLLIAEMERCDLRIHTLLKGFTLIDTLPIARKVLADLKGHSMKALYHWATGAHEIPNAHNALSDVRALTRVMQVLRRRRPWAVKEQFGRREHQITINEALSRIAVSRQRLETRYCRTCDVIISRYFDHRCTLAAKRAADHSGEVETICLKRFRYNPRKRRKTA